MELSEHRRRRQPSGDKAVEFAQHAERLGYDSIWVYDHFHNVPRPAHEAVFECWTTMAAISQLHDSRSGSVRWSGCNSYRNPAVLAKITVDDRRDLGRSARLGHRRRLVRERVPRLRVRVPEAQGPHRDAARDGRDRAIDVDASPRRRTTGKYYELRRAQLRPEAAAAAAPADLDRWRRRAADAARRRPPRRLLELRWAARQWAHKRDVLRGPLRGGRARPRRDPDDVVARGVHPLDRGRDRRRRVANRVGRARRRVAGQQPRRYARAGGREDAAPTSISAAAASSPGAPTTPTPRRSSCSPPR